MKRSTHHNIPIRWNMVFNQWYFNIKIYIYRKIKYNSKGQNKLDFIFNIFSNLYVLNFEIENASILRLLLSLTNIDISFDMYWKKLLGGHHDKRWYITWCDIRHHDIYSKWPDIFIVFQCLESKVSFRFCIYRIIHSLVNIFVMHLLQCNECTCQ